LINTHINITSQKFSLTPFHLLFIIYIVNLPVVRPRSCRVIYYFDTPTLRIRHQSFDRVSDCGLINKIYLIATNIYIYIYMDKLVIMYVNKVVRLYGVPESIVLDRDPRFTSRLWPSIQHTMGTKLNLSTTFHNKQSKRIIQILENLLRFAF